MTSQHLVRICKSVGALALLGWGLAGHTTDVNWETTYRPTRAEWLTYEVTRDVEQLTNLWATRVAVVVTVDPRKESVDLFVGPAAAQDAMGQTTCNDNHKVLEQRVRRTVRQHDWALNAVVFVTCL